MLLQVRILMSLKKRKGFKNKTISKLFSEDIFISKIYKNVIRRLLEYVNKDYDF